MWTFLCLLVHAAIGVVCTPQLQDSLLSLSNLPSSPVLYVSVIQLINFVTGSHSSSSVFISVTAIHSTVSYASSLPQDAYLAASP